MSWLYPNEANYYFGGKNSVDYYNNMVTERRKNYPISSEQKYEDKIKEINENGFTKWESVLDIDLLDSIKDKTEYLIKNNINLKSNDEYYGMVADPFLNVKECIQIAFSDMLLDFATDYFNCMPGIGTFNLRKSYLNNLPPKTTQLFHCDKNSIKFFKFFIYLNDVDGPEDGPLTIIKSSHKKRPYNHFMQHRWTEQDMKNLYGEDSLCYLTAKKGDLIAATTTCYHRGTKPVAKERMMLTLNYLIHPEESDRPTWTPDKMFKIGKKEYEDLPQHKKPAADFLIKV